MYFCIFKALFEKSKTEKSDEICKLANRNPTERNINVNYSTSAHNLVSSSFEVENLPWVMLWNKEGFTVGDAPNTIQKAYGFYGIPFIVLIDKKGRILARGLRGEKVREEILKARMNVE